MRRPRTCRHWPTASCGSSCGRVERCSTAGMAHRPGSRMKIPKVSSVRLRVVGRQVGSTPVSAPRSNAWRFFWLFRLRRGFQGGRQPQLQINCNGGGSVRLLAGAGTGGLAGHAVNASMEARGRHAWRPTVPPTHPCPPLTVRWFATDIGKQRSKAAKQPTNGRLYRVALLFDGHRPTVWGGGVWVHGAVAPHGCGARAYTDVLAACPANPHTPTQPYRPQSRQLLKLLPPHRLTSPTSPTRAQSEPPLLPGAVLPACRPAARVRRRGSVRNPARA